MKSFRLNWKWNAEGVKLLALRQLFESRGFDLSEGEVRIRVDEEGNWDFFNPQKPQSQVLNDPEENPASDESGIETATIIVEEKPKRQKPICKKCGQRHWPMHKCPEKEN